MIPGDITKDLIEQSIERARALTRDARVTEAWQFEDYRLADQLNNPLGLEGAKGVKYDELPKITLPFVDTILRELGKLYKKQPQRYVDSEPPSRATRGAWTKSPYDKELIRWHTLAEEDEADYLPTLKLGDDLTRFHGRTIVRVWPAFAKGSPEHKAKKNYPRFDVFHPGQFDVITDPRYPSRAVAYILLLDTADAAQGENRVQIWTAKESVMVVNGKEEQRIPHPKGLPAPFVGLANTIDPQSYWNRMPLARKLVVNNAVFDLGWTHLFGMAINQLHGQPVAYNADDKWIKDPKWGWDKVVNIPDKDGKFELAQSGANVEGMIAVLEKFVERVYWSCNLPTNVFRQDAGVESGAAYRVKNGSILEDREERASLFAPRERAIWRLAFLVGAAFGIHNISAPPKSIVIDYAPPEIPVPQQEEQTAREWNLGKSLINMIDEYRRLNPDVGSDDEALEELRRNAEINAEFLGVKAASVLQGLVGQARKAAEAKAAGQKQGVAAQVGAGREMSAEDEGEAA